MERQLDLIRKALNMERYPIGFKFLPYKKNYDESQGKKIEASLARVISKASMGECFKVNINTFPLQHDSYVIGIKKPNWEITSGIKDFKLGNFFSYSIAHNVVSARRYPEFNMYGAEIGPLTNMISPDLAIFICNSKTVMRIIQGYTRYFGLAKNLQSTGIDGIGVDLISKPFCNNDINYSLFNSKDRIEGKYLDNEIGLSLPIHMINLTLKGVLETVNLTENNRPKMELLERLEYPEELGFPIKMNYDYALEGAKYMEHCKKCEELE